MEVCGCNIVGVSFWECNAMVLGMVQVEWVGWFWVDAWVCGWGCDNWDRGSGFDAWDPAWGCDGWDSTWGCGALDGPTAMME